MSIENAFHKICTEATRNEGKSWYVVLMWSQDRYGGPEEGGWWTTDYVPSAWQRFATEEQAETAKEAVLKLATELNNEAKRAHGEYCQRSMEWLDARGLDADYLPEPDGPESYSVWVMDHVPTESRGATHYE